MFRHQIDTFGILLEFGHDDPVLLKASLIHDLLEDGHKVGFTEFETIIGVDADGKKVFDLVSEVSIRTHNGIEEPKQVFLERVIKSGTRRARLLKLADRLANINTLYASNDRDFIKKYILETRMYILPFAGEIDNRIAEELEANCHLIESTI